MSQTENTAVATEVKKSSISATVRKGYFVSQFALIQAGLPVKEAVVMTVEANKDFIIKSFEIAEIAEKNGVDEVLFTEFLKEVGAFVESKAKEAGVPGERKTRIDSAERALEVLNVPTEENVARFTELMKQLVAVAKEASTFITEKGSISLAIKNKKSADVEGTLTDETSTDETSDDENI